MLNRLFLTFLTSLSLATVLFAQNLNTAAVDTLTKDVATAVFANISQPKAREIYAQLLECSDGCDAQNVIRQVGGWDAVGAKLEELALLKSTERFQKMSPAEANAAIRRQLSDFYTRHKAEKPYSVPLSPDVQAQMLAKIDQLLPPAQPEPAETTPAQANGTDQPVLDSAATDESGISATALQMSRLERELKDEQDKRLWSMIISGLIGLIAGAAAVYFLLYRSLKAEADELTGRNNELSRQLDAQRSKPANTPNQLDIKQNVDAYEALRVELGADPRTVISQLRQQVAGAKPAGSAPIRSGELRVESPPVAAPEPAPVPPPVPAPTPAPMMQSQGAPPAPAQSEVLYFPPPDPNGLFDGNRQAPSLAPESAYRFSIRPDKPDEALFRFDAEPGRVARFLTYRNYMIEPACDSENSYSSQHTRVVNQRDGEAVRENGGWRVKTKAVIRYE